MVAGNSGQAELRSQKSDSNSYPPSVILTGQLLNLRVSFHPENGAVTPPFCGKDAEALRVRWLPSWSRVVTSRRVMDGQGPGPLLQSCWPQSHLDGCQPPWGLVKMQMAGPTPASHSVGLGWGPGTCISHRFPGDVAAAAGPGTAL